MSIKDIQLPALFRDGYHVNVYIDSQTPISSNLQFKAQIHDTIADGNLLTRTGISDKKFSLRFLVKAAQLEEVEAFLKQPRSFVLASNEYGIEVVNIYEQLIVTQIGGLNSIKAIQSNIDLDTFVGDDYAIDVSLTTALEPDDISDLKGEFLQYVELWSPAKESPASLLDKLKNASKSINDFTSNVNETISSYTNAFSQYANSINQIFTAIGGLSTIITSSQKSVFDAASNVQAGIESMILGIGNAIEAIKRTPDDIQNSLDAFVALGSQLRGLFSTGNPEEDNKAAILTLQAVSDSILNTKIEYKIPYDPFIEMQKDNFIEVMLVGSCLINIYDSTSQIGRWNQKDLDKLREKTERYYKFLVDQNLGSNFTWALSNFRSQFYQIYILLQNRALRLYEYVPNGTESIMEIVYKVNGNYQYLEETRAYNNIIGLLVKEPIWVIRND